jgi:aminoglycoside phosphotransferase (APT) family kinase protein
VPLSGGFDTAIYAFRLRRAPPPFAGPLILRVLGLHHDPARVLRERATQNAVADLGYPAPRVLLAETDAGPVGGPFLVMERLPGVVLPRASPLGMAGVLVEHQLRLHALDPEPMLRALDQEAAKAGRPSIGRAVATFDGYLNQFERRITDASLGGLAPAMAWLRARRPHPEQPPVICHGDFHPQNILVRDGAVTGVVDWPNAIVAEPAFDVAATRVILRFVPVTLATMSAPARLLARMARPILATRYLAGYRRGRPLDSDRLAYYEVASCMRSLLRVGESRRRSAGTAASPDSLDIPSFIDWLTRHIATVARVNVSLPVAWPGQASVGH